MRTRAKYATAITAAIAGVLIVALAISFHYQAEQYQIVHASFYVTTNKDVLLLPGTVCYSNEQLERAARNFKLENARDKSFNLDEPDVIACILPGHTVEKVVGLQDLGFIVARRSTTNGISLTIFRGTERMLQFNFPDGL